MLFLKERLVVDLEELAKLTEQFESAHGSKATVMPAVQVDNLGKPETKVGNSRSFPTRNGPPRPKCYNCGKTGHIAWNCFQKAKTVTHRSPGLKNGMPKFNREHHTCETQRDVSDRQEGQREVQQNQLKCCRAHGRVYCQDCLTLCLSGQHTCNAS